MNNEEQWTYQLSLKLGQDRSALLNVRAKDIGEFAEALRNLTSNAPEIANAAVLFEPPKKASLTFEAGAETGALGVTAPKTLLTVTENGSVGTRSVAQPAPPT